MWFIIKNKHFFSIIKKREREREKFVMCTIWYYVYSKLKLYFFYDLFILWSLLILRVLFLGWEKAMTTLPPPPPLSTHTVVVQDPVKITRAKGDNWVKNEDTTTWSTSSSPALPLSLSLSFTSSSLYFFLVITTRLMKPTNPPNLGKTRVRNTI